MQHTVSSAGRKKWYCLHVSVGEMMRTQTCVSRNCWHNNLGIGRVRRDARHADGLIQLVWGKEKSKVDEFILRFWTTTRLFLERIRLFLPRLGGLLDATTSTADLLQDDRRAAALQQILTVAAFSLDTPPHPAPQNNPHVKWKTIWKLKATMRGRMTVLQFLVILTVKSQIHHHRLLTLPLSTYSGYEGRRQDPNGSVTAYAFGSTRHCLLDRKLRHPRTPESGSSAAPSRGAHRF